MNPLNRNHTVPTKTIEQPDPHLHIAAIDEQGPGGAHHDYLVSIAGAGTTRIYFQKGGIAEAGVNGLTNEALLEIVRHRLGCFQDGPFKCHENAVAFQGVEQALRALYERTRERRRRGVEGTSTV